MKKHWSSQLITRKVMDMMVKAITETNGVFVVHEYYAKNDIEVRAMRDMGYVKFFERRMNKYNTASTLYRVTEAGKERLRKEGLI